MTKACRACMQAGSLLFVPGSPCCAAPAAAPLLPALLLLLPPAPTSVKKPAAVGPPLLLEPLVLGSFTTGSTTSTALALLPLLLLALPLLLGAAAAAAAAAGAAAASWAGAAAAGCVGLPTRAANLSPRGALLSAAAAAAPALTGVAVVSTGGVKLGLKGLEAPYGPKGAAPGAAAPPKGLQTHKHAPAQHNSSGQNQHQLHTHCTVCCRSNVQHLPHNQKQTMGMLAAWLPRGPTAGSAAARLAHNCRGLCCRLQRPPPSLPAPSRCLSLCSRSARLSHTLHHLLHGLSSSSSSKTRHNHAVNNCLLQGLI